VNTALLYQILRVGQLPVVAVDGPLRRRDVHASGSAGCSWWTRLPFKNILFLLMSLDGQPEGPS
jgi:hypothetical protein